MLGRVLSVAAVAVLFLGLSACDATNTDSQPGSETAATPAAPEGPIGNKLAEVPDLFPKQDAFAAKPAPMVDPIVLADCQVNMIEKREVPAARDGVLLFIGTELKPGEPEPTGDRRIVVKMGDKEKVYRRLKEDDQVEKDQLLAIVDNRLALAEVASKEAKITASKADFVAADKTNREAHERYVTMEKLYASRSGAVVSLEDLRGARLIQEKTYYELLAKAQAEIVANMEYRQAQTTLGMHEIRSPIAGVIKTIYKYQGESIKNLDPVFQIRDLTHLRAEGMLDVQYVHRVHKGMKAFIDPYRPYSPAQTKIGHIQEVTCVAVSKDKDNPLIVSGSEDGTVRVWDRKVASERRILRHTPAAAVRALACTPPRAEANLCLTGTADGVVRLWDLAADSDQPLWENKDKHRAVTAVAFSLDGRYFVTGGGDGQICLWETASHAFKYAFPAGHRAAVTTLRFTPQSQVVSAARDNTVRVWTVGEQGAHADTTYDRRSGEVAQLDVSPDGTRVVFDQGKALRVRKLTQVGETEGVLYNPGGSSNFATLALFSPDGKQMLTAGTAEGRLQLWRAPDAASRRGRELCQFIDPLRGPITCAAFAPDGSFIVTGSRDRLLQVWTVPAREEIESQVPAVVSLVERAVESSNGQVRIWADFENPNGALLPGYRVTLVVPTE